MLVVGIGLNLFYHIAKHYQLGNIGAPTDIGGGLFLLIGYLLVIGGLVLIVTTVLNDRRAP